MYVYNIFDIKIAIVYYSKFKLKYRNTIDN